MASEVVREDAEEEIIESYEYGEDKDWPEATDKGE